MCASAGRATDQETDVEYSQHRGRMDNLTVPLGVRMTMPAGLNITPSGTPPTVLSFDDDVLECFFAGGHGQGVDGQGTASDGAPQLISDV
jgi:hypothetical protein